MLSGNESNNCCSHSFHFDLNTSRKVAFRKTMHIALAPFLLAIDSAAPAAYILDVIDIISQ